MNHEYIKAFERFEELKSFRPKLPKKKIRSSWKHARRCMDRFVEKEYTVRHSRKTGKYLAVHKRDPSRAFEFKSVRQLNRSRIEYSHFYCPICEKQGRVALNESVERQTFPAEINISTSGRLANESHTNFKAVTDRKVKKYKEYVSGNEFRIVPIDGVWSVCSQFSRKIYYQSHSKGFRIEDEEDMYFPPIEGWRKYDRATGEFKIDPRFTVQMTPSPWDLKVRCEHVYVGDLQEFMNQHLRRMGSLSLETDVIVSIICEFLQPSSLLYIPFKELVDFTEKPSTDLMMNFSGSRRKKKQVLDDGW